MIAKRIARRAATSNAARLVRYMVAAEGEVDPQSWARTADYVLATRTATTQGEKVAGYRVTNCGTDDPGDATTLIQATQLKNSRSKADKTYHLVYSFRHGENPSLGVLHKIEDELCEVLGYTDHQRISAVHIDTDNLHVHVAINKVHPTGLQNIEPFYDKQRLMETCERLEKKFGLEHDGHGLTGERAYDRRNRIRLNPERKHDSRFRAFLREAYARALAEGPEAASYDDLRKLTSNGVVHGLRSYSMLLPGNARHYVDQGGTQHVDGMRRAENGAGRDGAGISGAAADMEAQAGIESLTGYVARDVAPDMRQAATWKELHAALAEHGLQIKPRGAGLVIGDPGLGLWCKASECGRDLSLKALTDRLGPFERGPGERQQREPGSRGYAPRPRQAHPSSAALFSEYQRQRQAAIASRKAGMAAIRTERASEMERIKRWSATQRMIQKVGPRGPVRAAINATTRTQVAAARNAAKANAEAATANLYKATTLPTWNQWLMQRAERGGVDALDVLRAREERAERMRGELLTAERAEKAKTRIMESLRPQAQHDGTMAYRTADGGLVLDRTSHVKAEKATAGAALVALSLAAERFEGQPLDVQGSDQFRQDVARLAGMHGINVRFSDPTLEIARQAMAHERSRTAAKPIPETTGVSRLIDPGSDRDERQLKEQKRMLGRRGRDWEI
ncbi:MAG: relaxase/mobilization nuclease domain-containing protein [Acidocella sp.]|nr:relaxase/mobilization nuclease domain-containing protein [Acidocella sp.]